jgi:hypothetical protein
MDEQDEQDRVNALKAATPLILFILYHYCPAIDSDLAGNL